jgi:hypothetical protein
MLEKELEFFSGNKEEYLKHHLGQFVVIHGTEFVGAYSTEEIAYAAGLQKFGNVAFLIKQVLPVDNTASLPAYSFGLLSA